MNRVIRALSLVARKQPPQGGRGDVRIYYGSQVDVEPPVFVSVVEPSQGSEDVLCPLRVERVPERVGLPRVTHQDIRPSAKRIRPRLVR